MQSMKEEERPKEVNQDRIMHLEDEKKINNNNIMNEIKSLVPLVLLMCFFYLLAISGLV